jgi:hypothetical protein
MIFVVTSIFNNASRVRGRMSTYSLIVPPATLAMNTAENARDSLGVFSGDFDGGSFASEGCAVHVHHTIADTIKPSPDQGVFPGLNIG